MRQTDCKLAAQNYRDEETSLITLKSGDISLRRKRSSAATAAKLRTTIGARKTLRSSDQKAIGDDITTIHTDAQTSLRISPVTAARLLQSHSEHGSAIATSRIGQEYGSGCRNASTN